MPPDRLPLTGLSGLRVLLTELLQHDFEGFEVDRATDQVQLSWRDETGALVDAWFELKLGEAPFMEES